MLTRPWSPWNLISTHWACRCWHTTASSAAIPLPWFPLFPSHLGWFGVMWDDDGWLALSSCISYPFNLPISYNWRWHCVKGHLNPIIKRSLGRDRGHFVTSLFFWLKWPPFGVTAKMLVYIYVYVGILRSAERIGSPYFHGLGLSSEPHGLRIMGQTVVGPKRRTAFCDASRNAVSTADAPQRGQTEFTFCRLPCSYRKSINIRL